MKLTDRGAVLIAIAAAAGAWRAWPVPIWMVAATVAILAVIRRPLMLGVLVALVASLLSSRAWAGMVAPPPGPQGGWATLVNDPTAMSGAVRVEVELGGRHLDAWAYSSAGRVVQGRLAGDRLYLRGTITQGRVPEYLRVRHIVSRLNIERVEMVGRAQPLAGVANSVRRVLSRGADGLDREQRALFTGLVIGDDREQSLETTDDFRGAGLSHLLAVSGQNVAFVLAAAAPLSTRLGLRARLAVTIVVLIVFATITRFEPSVLRATAMAGLACTASTLGRPVPAVRILALAVGGLLLVDPFLVRSVGFGLSVAASAGIVLLRGPVADVLPGPVALRNSLAVILAAQLGVAPLLITVFGGVPVASIPANLLAEPFAGFVMIWGASAGLVAGLVPRGLAELIHVPTSVAIWWIALVARRTTDARLGELGSVSLGLAVTLGAGAAWLRSHSRRLAVATSVLLLAALMAPAIGLRRPVPSPHEVPGAGTLSHPAGGPTVLTVATDARASDALRAVRRAGVSHLDVLILSSSNAAMQAIAAAITRRVDVERVVVKSAAPP